MKRIQLLKYLHSHGCKISREGKQHTIFWNSKTERGAAVPKHSEIENIIVEVICKELGQQC
ncbi:addiction module toxin, HicA family [bacterium]|nr:addiction module toxin, HicA family [bacterium]